MFVAYVLQVSRRNSKQLLKRKGAKKWDPGFAPLVTTYTGQQPLLQMVMRW